MPETQVNPKLTDDLIEKLDAHATAHNLRSRNEAAADIVGLYFSEIFYKKGNNVIMLDRVLALMLDAVKHPEHMDKNAETAGGLIITEIESQMIKLTRKEFKSRIKRWHLINPFKITGHKTPNTTFYMIQHDLGIGFSEFQAKMYKSMLKRLGITVPSTHYDEFCYKLEIMWEMD